MFLLLAQHFLGNITNNSVMALLKTLHKDYIQLSILNLCITAKESKSPYSPSQKLQLNILKYIYNKNKT